MLRSLIASILLAFLAILPAHAEVKIPAEKCAFIVASRETISEVNGFLSDLDESLLENAQVIEANNGWYVISIGVFREEKFEAIKASRVAKGLVPADSLCSKGKKYARVLAPAEYTLPVKVDVSDWVPVGPNAPSLALTGRAPIKFSRTLREGEQPIVLCPKMGLGCQFVDETGSALTDRVFDSAGSSRLVFADSGLAAIKVGEKWGYINESGAWVVEPVFEWAEKFDVNGTAVVRLGEKYGYINSNGIWVVDPKFDLALNFDLSGLATVRLGGKYGYINSNGAWVVKPKFDGLGYLSQNGLAQAQLGSKSGYINTSGVWVVEPQFESAFDFYTNAMAPVKLGEKWGYINANGAWEIEPTFTLAFPFDANGLASVQLNERYGYINASGAWAVEPKFDWAGAFAPNGLAMVLIGEDYGFIDASGDWVVEPKFKSASGFDSSGLAQARQNENYGILDASGAWVIEPLYDGLNEVAGGLFRVYFGNNQYQGLLKSDGTPLTFTEEEFRLAEIEGNQMRLVEELAKKDAEIKRLQDEAANAQAQAAQPQQRAAGQCDHVYVGRRNITIKDSGYFGIDFMWDVIGVGQNRASLRQSGGTLTRELPCNVIPY